MISAPIGASARKSLEAAATQQSAQLTAAGEQLALVVVATLGGVFALQTDQQAEQQRRAETIEQRDLVDVFRHSAGELALGELQD